MEGALSDDDSNNGSDENSEDNSDHNSDDFPADHPDNLSEEISNDSSNGSSDSSSDSDIDPSRHRARRRRYNPEHPRRHFSWRLWRTTKAFVSLIHSFIFSLLPPFADNISATARTMRTILPAAKRSGQLDLYACLLSRYACLKSTDSNLARFGRAPVLAVCLLEDPDYLG